MSDKIKLLERFGEMLSREERGVGLYESVLKRYGKSGVVPPEFAEKIGSILKDEKNHIAFLTTIIDMTKRL